MSGQSRRATGDFMPPAHPPSCGDRLLSALGPSTSRRRYPLARRYVGFSRRPDGDCSRSMSKLLEADDVAEMLGMSKDWIYGEVRAGRIPHVRLGRYVRFRAEAIEDWIRESERGKIPGAT